MGYSSANVSTLQWTAAKGSGDGMGFLLPDARCTSQDVLSKDVGDGWPMLHHAAHIGNHETIAVLLAARADVNQVGSCGYTAKEWAETEGHVKVLQAFAQRELVVDSDLIVQDEVSNQDKRCGTTSCILA